MISHRPIMRERIAAPGLMRCARLFAAFIVILLSYARAYAAPICIDDICIEVPTAIDYTYSVKAADFDNNGLTDLYVHGRSMTFVNDFIILQTTPLQFALADPTANQRIQGRSLPKTSVAVYREELSNDGLLDFQIENVDEVIPGAPNITILTSYGDGTRAETLIEEDEDFLRTVAQIESALENLDAVMRHYRGLTCTEGIIDYDIWWRHSESGEMRPDAGGSPADTPADQYPYWEQVEVPIYGTVCTPNSSLPQYQGDLGVFCGGMSTFLAQNGFVNPSDAGVLPRVLQQAQAGQIVPGSLGLRGPPPEVLTQTAKRQFIKIAARRAAILLILGPVGAPAVAVASLALLAYEGYTLYQEHQALRQTVQRKRRDALVAPTLGNPNYDEEQDEYQAKDTCKPWDNVQAQQSAPTPEEATAERLGKNLEMSGCGCKPGLERHHVAMKTGGGLGGDRLRKCLKDAGINLDWAGNGICLPKSDNDPLIKQGRTRIASHQNSGLHRHAYMEQLAEDCEQATRGLSGARPGDPRFNAARDFLDRTRDSLYHWRTLP